MQHLIVAAIQMACGNDRGQNIITAETMVREAASSGAQLILLPELFETPYFCKDMDPAYMALATRPEENPAIAHMRTLAAELGVVLPVSFFERGTNAFFNSLAMIDADGSVLGIYRKSHIPDGPGYSEKYYFAPGNTGFCVWDSRAGRIGAAICWDQWFPETARILSLRGAELLLYPTAIGSEPQDPGLDSSAHWRRVMQGHAAANMRPVIAANRIGYEQGASCALTFYGSSFIAGHTGEIIIEAGRDQPAILLARLDMAEIARQRLEWGMFRDRRPSLYSDLLSLDGGL
ncbi:MAG: N-carbamoylputrescine amidase [Pseudomonadota bacterium]|jgi:N-carbamoylputrescine amidase|nr:N-carbamoylputrescine amidase [Alphaproteobacteria bacterium]